MAPGKNPPIRVIGLDRLARLLPNPVARTVTVLSVDQQTLKLVHASVAARSLAVTALLTLPSEESDPLAVVEPLKAACKERGIEPETILIANPAHLTTMRIFSVPSSDWREIRDIVDLQAEKHTPYSKDEILTDFTVVETDPSGYSKVMLVISHHDVVNRALRLVEAMEWSLERVGLAVEGLAPWLRIVRPALSKAPVLLVDIDADLSTAAVLNQGRLLFSRSLPFGIRELIAEPSGQPSRLVAELRRTLEAFEGEGWKVPLTHIVLTGQVERLPDLAEQIQKSLELPTEAVSATEHFTLAPPVVARQQEVGQVSFANLLGLAAGPGVIDLTPKALRLHRAFELRTRALITLGCQCLAVLMFAAAIVVFSAHQQERMRGLLAQESLHAEEEANNLDFSLKQVEVVRNWLSGRGQFLDLLVDLNKHSADAIRWDTFDYSQGERLVLKGTSSEMPRVYDLVAALKTSPSFQKVDTRKVTERKEGEQKVTSFELTCELANQDNEQPKS